MRVPLTIAGLPELQSFTRAERARLLAAAHAPGPVRLWAFNLSRGVFLAAVAFLVLHFNGISQQLVGPLGVIALLGGTAVFGCLVHFWTITRIRGQLRIAIESASRGRLVPICLQCGHDCSSVESERCPECGADRRVSPDPETARIPPETH